MSRPTKTRRVCSFPNNISFSPETVDAEDTVILTIDEYETIRLIDKEALSQEECSIQLGVARTTAQKIYETARKKLAEALVMGLPLRIEGGNFSLCHGGADVCYKEECNKSFIKDKFKMEKGEKTMRIAVTYENGNVFQHFGHTEKFKIYDITDGAIKKTEIVDTNGQGHGALAGVLSALNADVLICGGIGGGAKMALADARIKLYGGVSGKADEAVNAFILGNLEFNPDVHCTHHEHEHGDDHSCNNHGCSGNCSDH